VVRSLRVVPQAPAAGKKQPKQIYTYTAESN
jgi:hypothetical protein